MSLILEESVVTPEVKNAFAAEGVRGVRVIVAARAGLRDALLAAAERAFPRKVRGATDYYVFLEARTLESLERFAAKHPTLVEKIWLDKPVRALAERAAETAKAAPARRVFAAAGREVVWAVLDTGINFWNPPLAGDAPAFAEDFSGDGKTEDLHGHGTHVAGILKTMAPEVKLANFKVLDGEGQGSDSGIIEALWRIRRKNLEARKLIIHGANLSLGGPVPVGSYGVGMSPICQEANRLMRSGVLVVVAAGNSGHNTYLVPGEGNKVDFLDGFSDLSIEDPGSAQDVITVGSVHTENPHTFGVSYFSSKGPTGDGRPKPDVVAPGEKLRSASHKKKQAEPVEMSGTSMAAPVVSGVLAQLLSRHAELVGETARVKELLMKSCTDLGRDRYFQGAGLVDALRLLQSV